MDTQTAKKNVDAEVAVIKAKMPGVYKQIQERAASVAGTFELVRRGLRGEANCFYAFEAGHVVGAPFNNTDILDHVAVAMVKFGCAHVCIFPMTAAQLEQANGSN